MLRRPLWFLAVMVLSMLAASLPARAGDVVRITIPKRSKLTPVQRLNREGVEAVKKHDYAKAESLFYKAYLFDPADPFTLNNLGFVSELQGDLDRAHKFYDLASEQGSNADIEVSNVKTLEGRPMKDAFQSLHDTAMKVNRDNVNAMGLLAQGRGFESVDLLKEAIKLDPNNPFTLNNLGVAEETIGDSQSALRDYWAAARTQSKEPVVVTKDHAWTGKPVSDMAADNEKRLTTKLQKAGRNETEAAMYSIRGVLAVNENDLETAKRDFMRAYSLDPNSAFTLNNRGYVAELEGDLESAQYFYEKAQKAQDANAAIGLASKKFAQGANLTTVAADSNAKVDDALDRYSEERRRQTGPVELEPRGGAGAANPSTSPARQSPNPPAATTPQLSPQTPNQK